MTNRNHPEWKAEYEERLGMLCGQEAPTREQEQMAAAEADEKVTELEMAEKFERIRMLARERRRDYAISKARQPHND